MMQSRLLLSLFLFMDSVFGADETVSFSVMEGDYVTLLTDLSEIKNDDTLLWVFGPKGFVISQITRKNDLTSFFVTDDVGFRGRLQVDQNTGSLTIRNTRIHHSGQYKLTISRERSATKIFSVTVFGVVNETDGMKSMSVMEGDSVTLHTIIEIHTDDLIVWRFGDKGILLAKLDVGINETSLNLADERFRDRLQLDHQTGSLTITNIRTEHAGLYEVQIRGRESSLRFLLFVTEIPVMGLSPGAIAGITVAVLLFAVVIHCQCRIFKLKKQACEDKKSAEEGESVTLDTGLTEIHKEDKIQWCYEDENNLIAEIIGTIERKYPGADGRFRSKLSLDNNGNLTINNIRTIHTGLYKLKISSSSRRRRTKYKRFILTVGVKTVSVTDGDPVTLPSDAEIQTNDLILWTFGAENSLVAKKHSTKTHVDEGRMKLDETGSLIIENIRTTDSGHFKLQIINSQKTTFRRYNVDVTGKQAKGEK